MHKRLLIFKNILGRPWVKGVAVIYGILSFYDFIGAQLLSQQLSEKLPRLNDLLIKTTGWLSIWQWLAVGFALVAAAAVEHLVRREKVIATELAALKMAQTDARSTEKADVNDMTDQVSLFDIPTLSDTRLKKYAIEIARQMRLFEANRHLEKDNIFHKIKPAATSDDRWAHQFVEQHQAIQWGYKTRFHAKALAVRNELLSRNGLPPISNWDTRSQYSCTALDLCSLAGTTPITDAAGIIETLALRLS